MAGDAEGRGAAGEAGARRGVGRDKSLEELLLIFMNNAFIKSAILDGIGDLLSNAISYTCLTHFGVISDLDKIAKPYANCKQQQLASWC